MRQLRRPRVALPTLTGEGKGATTAAAHRRTKEANPSAALKFDDHWNEPDVRGALYAMHGWACAYCQCELPRNDRGDVEHFRPKSGEAKLEGYWWLAYDFENYLLACSVCNRVRKGPQFPLEAGAKPCSYADRVALDEEQRLIADPAHDRVEEWMRVDWMDPEQEGFVKASSRLANPSTARNRAEETILFFRLNEDLDLYRERLRALQRARTTYRKRDTDELRRSASRFRPHGASVRNFVEDVDRALLPSKEEELAWLLEDVDDRLREASRLLRTGPQDPRLCERMIRELCWTLAVLWKDPPAWSAARIEQWLEQQGWKDMVRPFLDTLSKAGADAR